MESAFGVVLPHSVRVNQAPTVGVDFRLTFQTRGDLRFHPLIDYLIAHPDELVAVRDYLQRLIDDGLIEPDFVVQVLREATHRLGMPVPRS